MFFNDFKHGGSLFPLLGLTLLLTGLTVGCGDPTLDETPVTFSYTGEPEAYVVPKGATALHVLVRGASGGAAEMAMDAGVVEGGHGAEVEAVIDVAAGDDFVIVVGGQPPLQPAGSLGACGASGGGGSYVAGPSMDALVVAGGGGGASGYFEVPGTDASTTRDGVSIDDVPGGMWGFGGGAYVAGGGGGHIGPGEGYMDVEGGASFLSGSAGGARDYLAACGTEAAGGFGGGGGGGVDIGGGGGGYSGGASGSASAAASGGGGGGSYEPVGTGTISIRDDHGHGSVVITPIPY